jgi:exodeoxyribonuclease VII large subunit
VLAAPEVMVSARAEDVARLSSRARSSISTAILRGADQILHLRNQVRSLSPQQTLDRGYAVVQVAGTDQEADAGAVVRHPAQAPEGSDLFVRVAGGSFAARSTGRHRITSS